MSCILGAPLSEAGGVTITGLDLSRPLPASQREQIREAFRVHQVVVFPEQVLSREQQFEFIANFGEIEPHGGRNAQTKRYAAAHVISNLDSDGNPVDRSASPVSNYRWHTDKAYYPVPPMLTALYAVELPPRGGDTEFANTAMGYAALTEAAKRQIDGLRVVFYWGAGAREPDRGRVRQRICENTRRSTIRSCAPIRRPAGRRSISATMRRTYSGCPKWREGRSSVNCWSTRRSRNSSIPIAGASAIL